MSTLDPSIVQFHMQIGEAPQKKYGRSASLASNRKDMQRKHLTFVGNAVVVVVGVGCKYRVQFMKKPLWIAILVVP